MKSNRGFTKLRRDTRGAVLAEFMIAIVPILMMFFSFIQLSKMAAARLVLKHSAIVAARAAAVITNNYDNNPCQPRGMNEGQILDAAKMALGEYWKKPGGFSRLRVEVTDTSSSDPYNWVTVKVTGTYDCVIPLGGRIACPGGTKTMEETHRMPHQGALYKSSECGGGNTGGAW